MLWIAAVAVLGGCGPGGSGPGGDDPGRLRQQARDALVRYDNAVLDAGGRQSFVPVGDLTGQLGDWEPTNGDNKQENHGPWRGHPQVGETRSAVSLAVAGYAWCPRGA